jgi:sugar lactone lactonase YvrE
MTQHLVMGGFALSWLVGCAEGEAAVSCSESPGQLCTVVGTGTAGWNGDGQLGLETDIYLPMDAALGPDKRLYFTDWNNHRIRALDKSGMVETVAGNGMLGDGPGGPALETRFNHPTSFTFDKLGRMVISAWHNSRIKRLDLKTKTLEDLCGTGKRAYTGDEGPAEMADLDLPASVALDDGGNMFIMDQANQVIRRVDEGGMISRFAGRCITGVCGEGETAAACGGTNKLACLQSDAMGCTKPCAAGFSGDGGPARDARFSQPVGQAADPAGRIAFGPGGDLFVADTGNNRIRRIDGDGMLSTVAGNGKPDYAGDGGAATEASLYRPVDVDVARDGTLYIADTFNSCVRAVDPSGEIRTVAGVCGKPGNDAAAGRATSVKLNRPYGIGLDADDYLYIADTYNHRVLKLVL